METTHPFLVPGDDARANFVGCKHRDLADEVEVGRRQRNPAALSEQVGEVDNGSLEPHGVEGLLDYQNTSLED